MYTAILSTPLPVRARETNMEPAVSEPATPAVKKPGFNELKLQGILYSTSNPSAIISGTTVRLNDRVAGALVVAITPRSVTLEYQGERKTLALK